MFRSRQRVLLAKEESSYGSDPTPTVAANAIDAFNLKVNYTPEILERNLVKQDWSPNQPLIGKRYIELSFSVELKGSGSLGVAPRIGDLFEACGLVEVVVASTSVTYSTYSSTKSITAYVYDIPDSGNARLHNISGCRGNVNFVFKAGQIPVAEFTFHGLYAAPTDVSAPSTPTYETTVPPIVESAAFTLNGSSALVVESMNVDLGNAMETRDDINSAAGIKQMILTGRGPKGTFNPESVLAATYDVHSDWATATARALSIVVGSAEGNKITMTAPKVSLDSIGEDDRNGIKVDSIPFRLSRDEGNDEFVLTFE